TRTRGNRDHRHGTLWSVRQYHRHPVASVDTDAAQPVKQLVRRCPERAICDRRAPGPQDSIAVGGGSRMAGKEVSQARKGMAAGGLACQPLLQVIDNIRHGPLQSERWGGGSKAGAIRWQDQENDRYTLPGLSEREQGVARLSSRSPPACRNSSFFSAGKPQQIEHHARPPRQAARTGRTGKTPQQCTYLNGCTACRTV